MKTCWRTALMIEIKITGLDELTRQLRDLTTNAQFIKEINAAMRAASKIIRDIAWTKFISVTKNAGKDVYDGSHKRSDVLAVKTGKKTGSKGARFWVGVIASFPASLLEYGTSEHTIEAKHAQSLGKDGSFGKVVHHPGQAPRPFLRPTIDAHAQTFIDRVVEGLNDALVKWGNKWAGIKIKRK